MYCKYCEEKVSKYDKYHECQQKGLLNVDKDDSFLVSTLIGAVSDSYSDKGGVRVNTINKYINVDAKLLDFKPVSLDNIPRTITKPRHNDR